MKDIETEQEMLRWLRLHHGVIRRSDARAMGATPAQIEWRCDSGIWIPMHRGVYRHSAAPSTPQQRLLAASWAAGTDGVASHRSAAWLWQLADYPDRPEVTVPHGRLPRLAGIAVHRSVDLPMSACGERHGIPVTDPFRTLIDLGAVVPPWAVSSAVDAAIARRLVTLGGLLQALDRISRQGVRGAGVLRRVLDERGVHSARYTPSVLESMTSRELKRGGVTPPTPELVAGEHGEFRLDFPWPEALLVLEVHGWAFHATPENFQSDIDRGNGLADLGWLRLVKTWRDVIHHPEKMVAQVRRHLFLRARNPA